MTTSNTTTANSIKQWEKNPGVAFQQFVRTEEYVKLGRRLRNTTQPDNEGEDASVVHPIRESSVQVYIAMFNKYLRWLDAQSVSFMKVQPVHILAFLNANHASPEEKPKKLNSKIRTRYLRMLERIYQHIKLTPNPASHASVTSNQTKEGRGRDKPTEYISATEIKAFMEHLPAPENWKRLRDRAMLAMLIGAGIKPSEILTLYVENVGKLRDDGCIAIQISAASVKGVSQWHQTLLRPFAVKEVQNWMTYLASINYQHKILFPSMMNGKKINSSTLYRSVKEVFTSAHIDVNRLGPRTLRNSYAVQELFNGSSVEEVRELLGLLLDKSMTVYVDLASLESLIKKIE